MKICYSVILSLAILNHFMCTVQSNWSIRKIFSDNLEIGSKNGSKELGIEGKLTPSPARSGAINTEVLKKKQNQEDEEEVEGDDDEDEYEYENAENNNKHGNKNNNRNKYNVKQQNHKEKFANNVLIKNYQHRHLSGEIIPAGSNNESFAILLKPTKIKKKNSSKNNNWVKNKKTLKHHRNSKHLKNNNRNWYNDNNNENSNENSNGNISEDNDYDEDGDDYEDDKDYTGSNEGGEESIGYDNKNDLIKNKDKMTAAARDNLKQVDNSDRESHESNYKGAGVIKAKALNRKVKQNLISSSGPAVITNAIQRQIKKCGTTQACPIGDVKVNGSVDGIIVMSFNFSDDGKKPTDVDVDCLNSQPPHDKDTTDNVEDANEDCSKPSKVCTRKKNNFAAGVGRSKTSNEQKEMRRKICDLHLKKPHAKLFKSNNCELYEAEENIGRKPKKLKANYTKCKICKKRIKNCKKLNADDYVE